MEEVRIWVFPKRQAGLLEYPAGHVAVDCEDVLYGLDPDKERILELWEKTLQQDEDSSNEPGPLKAGEVVPGVVFAYSSNRFGQMNETIRVRLARTSRPIQAFVYSRSTDRTRARDIYKILIDSANAPPRYSINNISESLNCCTFAESVLNKSGVLSFEVRGRRYLPEVFKKEMENLLADGQLLRCELREFVGGRWRLVEERPGGRQAKPGRRA